MRVQLAARLKYLHATVQEGSSVLRLPVPMCYLVLTMVKLSALSKKSRFCATVEGYRKPV